MTLIFLEVWSTCPSFGLRFSLDPSLFEVLICYHFDDLVGEEQGTSAGIQLTVIRMSGDQPEESDVAGVMGHLSILDDPQRHHIFLGSSHDLVDNSKVSFLSSVLIDNKIPVSMLLILVEHRIFLQV